MGRVVSGFALGIDTWNRRTEKAPTTRKGARTVAFTFLIISILIVFYLCFVSSRLWVVNLGYKTSQALQEQKDLLETNSKLRIERASLSSPVRIDSDAREQLHMREPQADQVFIVR
jgi:cell division protein FtsL